MPVEVAAALETGGYSPFVVMIEGEADPELSRHRHSVLALEEIADAFGALHGAGVTHVVLAGGITRRPSITSLRLSLETLYLAARVAGALLSRGDDALLRSLMAEIEKRGFTVVGAHEIVPDMLAPCGAVAGRSPAKASMTDIAAARDALRRLGPLDLGQAAVAVRGRVVAIEGPEGTDAVLSRVAELRAKKRLPASGGGVLVKCAKPGQELRADLPTIGPATVSAAVAAGLSGIAVEGGKTFILDKEETCRAAKQAGIFIHGLEPDTA